MTTFIDIDSSYRDRKQYPNPAEFTINYSENTNDSSIQNARNLISDGYPYYQWQWYCSGIGSDGIGHSTAVSTINGSTINGNKQEIIIGNRGTDGAMNAPTGNTISDNFTTDDGFFNGLILTLNETIATGVQSNGGDAASTSSVTMTVKTVDATTVFTVGDILCNSNAQYLGRITQIASATSIILGNGLAQIVAGNDFIFKFNTQKSRINNYNSTDNMITLSGDLSGDKFNIDYDWNITNSSSTTKIFVSGGSDRKGDYVGDYYECLMYGSSAPTNPTVHQFRKITSYNTTTKLITLESALSFFDGTNGASNKSGTHSTIYLNRIRRSLPMLPSGSSSLISGSGNIPLVTNAAVAGGIHSITISNGGLGYTNGDSLTYAWGTSGDDDADVTVDTVDSNGAVKTFTITWPGQNFIDGNEYKFIGGTGSNVTFKVGVGSMIGIKDAASVSQVSGIYKNHIFYYPAFNSGGGTASTDPSAAQDFIPHNNTLNVDNPGNGYTDSIHCSFRIYGHFYDSTKTIDNVIVIKSLSTTELGFIVANKEFNILKYDGDGVTDMQNFQYKDYKNLNPQYDIELINLTLPNTYLRSGAGGLISLLPYIYVELTSDNNSCLNRYNSNNPNSNKSIFKCVITDTSNPISSKFVKLRGMYLIESQFNLQSNLKFRVLMPNGESYRTLSSDNSPPNRPNKMLQISATLRLTEKK